MLWLCKVVIKTERPLKFNADMSNAQILRRIQQVHTDRRRVRPVITMGPLKRQLPVMLRCGTCIHLNITCKSLILCVEEPDLADHLQKSIHKALGWPAPSRVSTALRRSLFSFMLINSCAAHNRLKKICGPTFWHIRGLNSSRKR